MLLRALFISMLLACLVESRNPHRFHDYRRERKSVNKELTLKREWQTFKETFEKQYDSGEEEEYRLEIFAQNIKDIADHNDLYKKGVVTYAMKMNQFGDMTEEEFNQMKGFIGNTEEADIPDRTNLKLPSNDEIPEEMDWRKLGAVTKVKIQGSCGSSWAFSAVGALEGQYYIRYGMLIDLSPKNLIDCAYSFGNYGCKGGLPRKAYNYIELEGIDSEMYYPYEDKEEVCRAASSEKETYLQGYVWLPRNESILKTAVASVGPISVGIDSSGLRFYSHGIYSNSDCTNMDHAVVLVGYGTDEKTKKDYWLLKNSWGDQWGEEGYFRLARNQNNQCRITDQAVYPVLEKDIPY